MWMRTCLALLLLLAASARAPAASAEPPATPPASGAKPGSQAKPEARPDVKPDAKPELKDDSEPPPAPLTTEGEPEPPPAPLTTEGEPEPPPAPLIPEQGPRQAGTRLAAPRDTQATQRRLRGVGWGGVAATVALITAGTVLGVLTQQRSDALSVSTTQRAGGLPPVYDAEQHAAYLDLQSQGRTFNDATIACFVVGGALALTSGVLFWNATRLKNKAKQQLAARTGGLSAAPALELRGGPSIRAVAGGSVFLRGSF